MTAAAATVRRPTGCAGPRAQVQRCGPAKPDCGCDPLEQALAAREMRGRSEHASAPDRDALLDLQRRAGNAAVADLVRGGPVVQRVPAADAPAYNAARGYDGAAADVLAAHVASPTADTASADFAAAVAGWQAAPARSLSPDGKLGPRSLGIAAGELAEAGAEGAAAVLASFPQVAPPGAAASAPGAGGAAATPADSCAGTAKDGPGSVTELLDGPTHKRFELVNFDVGKSFLKAEHRAALRTRFTDPATVALLDDGWKVLVVGHASTTGSDAFNETLGRLRALCTRLFLLDVGMPAGAASHDSAGEAVARERLTDAGAPRLDDVESTADRRVQVDLVKTAGPGPTPSEEDDTCPSEEAFDAALCEEGRWQQVFDYCSQRLVTDKLWSDIACQALGPRECIGVWLGVTDIEDLDPIAKTCCTPSGGPDPAEIGEALVECSVREMADVATRHDWLPDCPELLTPDRLRDSLERCLPGIVPSS